MRVFASTANHALSQPIVGMGYASDRHGVSSAFVCNSILGALPEKEMMLLSDHLEFVYLESGREVCQAGQDFTHVYFPTTAIIAMLLRTADGAAIEMGAIGREGVVGTSAFCDKGAMGTAIVQFAGGAYRVKASVLEEICREGESLQPLLMRYTWSFLSHVLQSSMSGRLWTIEQRLSCWLLERLDRLSTNELKTTQEMIAGMLGVRRESITESIGKLRKKGMVRCRRGSITVLDRGRLERFSGECYLGSAGMATLS